MFERSGVNYEQVCSNGFTSIDRLYPIGSNDRADRINPAAGKSRGTAAPKSTIRIASLLLHPRILICPVNKLLVCHFSLQGYVIKGY
jgi:hypothetical protein